MSVLLRDLIELPDHVRQNDFVLPLSEGNPIWLLRCREEAALWRPLRLSRVTT